ncbi:adenylate kinase family protein [Haloprofundus sp. MHR1]|uniref:adenylate kinase family protein n=1 Tax=Haloprofundus sp. MHR1 TaxID=2572921 RepID=UPI0010BF0D82|nr:adenylate kinase family protein [Haloprofundus sp. MHR1]QCJ47994.1 adenylate kinase [Haloprofundus sp. MHR1]
MRVAVTGTPGTGKTSATALLEDEFAVAHLNDEVRDREFWTERDEERDSLVVDVQKVATWVDEEYGEAGDFDDDGGDVTVVESHLAHLLPADRVVVLRCRPDVLESRLLDRGENEAKAAENRESEALDVILAEAVEENGVDSVYEIETTDRSPAAVAEAIRAVVAGDREPSAGTVDYLEYL